MKNRWFRSAKIYQILIDRFAGADISCNKPDFLGGTIEGITGKLDYLSDLGINVIWLSPFWSTDKYHGYHILDFMTVDPRFGTEEQLRILIKEAHLRSIKVITDFVPNHISKDHPFFKNACSDRKSRYFKWFYFNNWPDDYLCFLDVKGLVKLNLDNPETARYIIDTAKYWLSTGIDGYRIDHIIGPSHKFWRRFYNEIKECYPESVLLGEAWGPGFSPENFKTINIRHKFIRKIFGISQESIQKEYIGEMDGVLDFWLNELIVKESVYGRGFTHNKEFRKKVNRHFNKYPEDYLLPAFLDNHDMNRFLWICKGDADVLLEALEFLISTRQPVIIYYGTERGMKNSDAVNHLHPNSDLYVREPVNWSEIDQKLYDRVKLLLRKSQV